MNKQQPSIAIPRLDEPAKPKVYKAFEFAQASSGEDLVLVRESRTYFYLDGRISHEMLLREPVGDAKGYTDF